MEKGFFSPIADKIERELNVPLGFNDLLGKTMYLFVCVVIGFETILRTEIGG